MSNGFDVVITALLPGNPRLVLKLMGVESFSSGAGGWQEVERPLREPALVWTKRPLRSLTFPLRFDGLSEGSPRRVDGDARSLEDWASSGYRPDGDHTPPTLVRVSALSGTLRNFATGMNSSTKYAITALEWGDFITSDNGVRYRQDVNVTFTPFTPLTPAGYAAALREALGLDDEDGEAKKK